MIHAMGLSRSESGVIHSYVLSERTLLRLRQISEDPDLPIDAYISSVVF